MNVIYVDFVKREVLKKPTPLPASYRYYSLLRKLSFLPFTSLLRQRLQQYYILALMQEEREWRKQFEHATKIIYSRPLQATTERSPGEGAETD